jgi:hypothetical protein
MTYPDDHCPRGYDPADYWASQLDLAGLCWACWFNRLIDLAPLHDPALASLRLTCINPECGTTEPQAPPLPDPPPDASDPGHTQGLS